MVQARTAAKQRTTRDVVRRGAGTTQTINTSDGPVTVQWVKSRDGRIAIVTPEARRLSAAARMAIVKQVQLKNPSTKISFKVDPASVQTPSRAIDDELDDLRATLVARFSPALEDLDAIPKSTVEQARRYALLTADLMRRGAFDYDALAEGWDTTVSAARKRVLRAKERSELFTVSYSDRTFVPSFLLDQQLATRPELAATIATLRSAGEDGFALWSWLTTPSSWLDGAVPEELARSADEIVRQAAERRASHAR